MKNLVLFAAFLISICLSVTSEGAILKGLWEFDCPANPALARVGNDLVFEGEAPQYAGSAADDGGTTLNGTITTPPALNANRIRCDHGVAPNGGGSGVNQYSIVVDILSPPGSRSKYRSIFQAHTNNNFDAVYFINPSDAMGINIIGYTTATINDSAWTRLVLTIDVAKTGGDVTAYVNGTPFYTHPGDVILDDSRYALESFLYFFADDNGDNAPLQVGAVALYDGVLTPVEVAALGAAGSPIDPASPPPPTLTSVNPTNGTTAGGTSVTLTGTNFTGAKCVTFGGTAATILNVTPTTITCTTPAHAAGAVNVLVATRGGTNGANTLFTYVTPPTLTSVAPSTGSTAGGTSVTLTGTNFTGTPTVTFGTSPATAVTVNSATQITCTTPAHAAGAVSVLVTTPGGTNAANTLFTYAVLVPNAVITSVSPSTVSTVGGETVTLIGTGFLPVTEIMFGASPPPNVTWVNATTITFTTPPHASGVADVKAHNPGTGDTSNYPVVIVPPPTPTLTGVSPNSGPIAGGTNVTLTGTNFTGTPTVTFGGTTATAVTVVSSTSITCTTPAHAIGAVSVLVTTPGGTNAANTLFTYAAPPSPPTLTSVSPNTGTTAGGTSVTLTGTNFTGTPTVTFGGNAATAVTLVSSTRITCTTPAAGAGGLVTVVVTIPGSTNTAESLFLYVPPTPPTLSCVVPSTGSAAGGTNVTLTGTGFTGATGVTFDGAAATSVNVVNATTLTCTTPAGAAGAASVVVNTPGGANAANTLFAYVATLAVVNPGAENPALGAGTFTRNNPGWTDFATPSDQTGIVRGGGAQNPAATEGANWFWLDSRALGGLYQQVGMIAADTAYTLNITLGVPITSSIPRASNFRFGLFAGTGATPASPVAVATQANVTAGSGQSQVFSLTFTALSGNPIVGQNLFIVMQITTQESTAHQIFFDAISLTAGAPPAPFRITDFRYNKAARTVDVTWLSEPGCVDYTIETSTDLQASWTTLGPPVPGAAGTTTTVTGRSLSSLPVTDRLLLRVRRAEEPAR